MDLIGPDNFTEEVLKADRPVLLLFMRHDDDDYPGQLKLVKQIMHLYGVSLKTCLISEMFAKCFKKKYVIHGTPTFLIFWTGQERNRMLGVTDPQSLQNFIQETLHQLENISKFHC